MAMPQLSEAYNPHMILRPERNREYRDARERHLARFAHPPAPNGCEPAKRIEWYRNTPRGKEEERVHPWRAKAIGHITLDQFSADGYALSRPITFQIDTIPHTGLYRANVTAWRGKASWVYTFTNQWEEHPVLAVEATMNDMLDSWRELEELSEKGRLHWPRSEEYKWLSRYFIS